MPNYDNCWRIEKRVIKARWRLSLPNFSIDVELINYWLLYGIDQLWWWCLFVVYIMIMSEIMWSLLCEVRFVVLRWHVWNKCIRLRIMWHIYMILYDVNIKHGFVWVMMDVVLSCLENNVMNNGGYVKNIITYTQTWMNECINEANENLMNRSLLKCSFNRTLIN